MPVTFAAPIYLLLLLALPCVWYFSRRSLAGFSPFRRWSAVLLRSVLLIVIVMALAEAQWVQVSDRVTVLYVVDRSESVPEEKTAAIIEYVNRSMHQHRDRADGDEAGVIVFGRQAAIELPPMEAEMPLADDFQVPVEKDATDLAGALKLAAATLPPDGARRLVVISDGNQNVGDALTHARALATEGVGIDVVPLELHAGRDIVVEKISLPSNVRRGLPFDVRVAIAARGEFAGRVPGVLRVRRLAGETETIVAERDVELEAGLSVFNFRDQLDAVNFYTYEARFIPDAIADDRQSRNNRATAFTQIRGRGQVLIIEELAKQGQSDELIAALRESGLEVTQQTTAALFTSLAELQPYDAVMLANVPRTSGSGAGDVDMFSDRQIDMLARNTEQMGAGLIMLGGPESFGAGDWAGTAIEAAMPVDFTVKNAKVVPAAALMLVIDRSGSMAGEKLRMSKAAALAAAKVLSSRDSLGVVAFDTEAQVIVPLQRLDNLPLVERSIGRLAEGGGTNMMPGVTEGYHALRQVDSAVRHMIILTDGQTEPGRYVELAAAAYQDRITTTCLAVGRDADVRLLDRIANAGGGKFYAVNSPRAIPRVFIKEAHRVARPLVYENRAGIPLSSPQFHEVLQGLETPPPIYGYLLTSVKENALVDVPLAASQPTGRRNAVLATWQYGLGRSVALTTDTSQRWARNWPEWSGYDKFFTQLARWAMRPFGDPGNYTIATEVRDRRVQVVVTALDEEQEFVNFLEPSGMVVGPGEPFPLRLEQTSPGRYVGEFTADKAGSYFVTLQAAAGQAPIRAGVSVPYSTEFNDRTTNETLLESLARVQPEGGPAGRILPELDSPGGLEAALETNPFRRDLVPAARRQDVWPLLLILAAVLLFVDVFNRRVHVTFAWVPPLIIRLRDRVLRRDPPETPSESIARLKARKREVHQQYSQQQASARFDPSADTGADAAATETPLVAQPSGEDLAAGEEVPGSEQLSYTERLLKAKRSAGKKSR